MIVVLAIVAILLAAIPAVMFFANLPLFCVDELNSPSDAEPCCKRGPNLSGNASETDPKNRQTADQDRRATAQRPVETKLGVGESEPFDVSVLIPARDEEYGIAESVRSVLASTRVNVELVVLDDGSSDRTATVVNEIAKFDARVRCIPGKELPEGWNGKQHACYQLAALASHQRLVFLDADVRLNELALWKLVRYQNESGVPLLSVFPHQETGTWLERWIIPLMHYILLGFLPMQRMRDSPHPAYASGCGQLFLTKRMAYEAAGTHAAIRASRHDGMTLPRAFRKADLMTDVVDGTELADCRMYRSAREVVAGVLKNADEGIARPKVILPFTILLIGGSVLPVVLLAASIAVSRPLPALLSLVGLAVGHAPRAAAAIKFRQSWMGVICHSLAVSTFICLQWVALANSLTGRRIAWRGRNA